MRLTLSSRLALTLILVSGTCSVALAQGQRPTTAPKGVQPKAQVTPAQARVEIPQEEERLSPELEELLKQWEMRSSEIKSLQGKHKRTIYNLVFQEEKQAEGKFYLETPDKGRIDLVGSQLEKGAKSARIGKNGEPFKLVSDRPERWICTGDEIVVVNDEDKTYEVMPLPAEAKGKNIVNTPLPFLFGMKAADAKRRFSMVLKKNTKEQALLAVIPKYPSDQQNYAEALVMLEKKNYLPTAVKLFDQSGNIETVYKFEEVDITLVNQRSLIKIFPQKDPFHLDFKRAGYTLVLPPLEENDAPVRPASTGQRSIPPEQPRSTNGTKTNAPVNRK